MAVPHRFLEDLRERTRDLPVDLVGWDLAAEEVLPGTDPGILKDVEVLLAPSFSGAAPERVAALTGLRAVVLMSAGYDHAVPHLPPGVALAPAVGVHDSATAEMALTLMLAAQREIPACVLAQSRAHATGDTDEQAARWLPSATTRSVTDARVVLVGYGGIGRALARQLRAAEADVVAVASRPRPGDDLVDRIHGIDELDDLLPTADVVSLQVPYGPATHHLLDARRLALLPDGALVVNVGRGGSVDTDALVAECAPGRLRAALDVTDPEPLPEDHPLWDCPGVLISPHRGGATTTMRPRLLTYLADQIDSYLRTGAPRHVVATG